MKIKSIKSLWGMEGPLERQFEKIAAAGYEGIECPLPSEIEEMFGIPTQEKQFLNLLEEYDLDYVAMVFTNGIDHSKSFREQVERAATYSPILINSHTASDGMRYDEQIAIFEKAQVIEQRLGIPIGHETHRGRAMFTPWTTASLLHQFPDLKLTVDFSHWVCVCESLLENQKEHLDLAIERTIHIHARVGHAQGPQVPHPAAPEYARELSAHEEWWKRVAYAHEAAGKAQMTFTPEFGPAGYMPTLPFTNRPVADLWEVCLWMKHRFNQLVK